MPLQHWGERDGEGIDEFLRYLDPAPVRISWARALYLRLVALLYKVRL